MAKSTYPQTNFTSGEISPRALGRFDLSKYPNAAAKIENFLMYQLGGAQFRPGTYYVAATKDSGSKSSHLMIFSYSTTQTYVMEFGDLYIRFFANGGQVLSGGLPVEVVTPYTEAQVPSLHFAQDADTLYITHTGHAPRKLTRTSATSFNLAEVVFIRGPFLDDNITAVTLTASADTGAGITITASAATFLAGHVGSLWRIKDGVVKVTAFTDTTHVTATVQAEANGTAGNLNTGGAAQTDWAEGAFSAVRGYPATVAFHEQRLYYAYTSYEPNKKWGSKIAAYDNFQVDDPITDESAVTYETASDQVNAIRWLASASRAMIVGTVGGTFSATSGNFGQPITASDITEAKDTTYGVADFQPRRIGSYIYYLQRNKHQLRELSYNYLVDSQISGDMTKLADHILRDGSGAKDLDHQQNPNDRIWIVRNDGEIAILTRNVDEEVMGWVRLTAGVSGGVKGIFESIAIEQRDGADDRVWAIVKRKINGSWRRYVEYFTDEFFTDDWDPVRVDSALSLDSPITIVATTASNPVVVNAPSHGLSNGDQVKIDKIEGMTELNGKVFLVTNVTTNTVQLTDTDGNNIDGTDYESYLQGGEMRKMVTAISGLSHLEGEYVSVQADGGLPAEQETYLVVSGAITLAEKAAVVHIGLPYTGKIQLLPQSDGSETGTGQTKSRRHYLSAIRVFRSLGFKVGMEEDNLSEVHIEEAGGVVGAFASPVTADLEERFESFWSKRGQFWVVQDKPLPLFVLAIILRSEVEESY